jgi:chemotaxis signal transduction protein
MTLTLSPDATSGRDPQAELKTSRFAVFRRGEQLFALDIGLVREVWPGAPLTRVARAGAHMQGVLSLRGEILPVVVIDDWLGLPPRPDEPREPILVLRQNELLVGLRVDAIQGVVNIPNTETQSHPSTEAHSLLMGLWQPPGQSPITLIDGTLLLDMLCRATANNL